jgi:hypothetical protein
MNEYFNSHIQSVRDGKANKSSTGNKIPFTGKGTKKCGKKNNTITKEFEPNGKPKKWNIKIHKEGLVVTIGWQQDSNI